MAARGTSFQPLWNAVNACFFEYGIALYDLGVGEALRSGDGFPRETRGRIRVTAGAPGVSWPRTS